MDLKISIITLAAISTCITACEDRSINGTLASESENASPRGKVLKRYEGCSSMAPDLEPLITDNHDLQENDQVFWDDSRWGTRPSKSLCIWSSSLELPSAAPAAYPNAEPDTFNEEISVRVEVSVDNQSKEDVIQSEERLIAEYSRTHHLKSIERIHHPVLEDPENWNLMLFREIESDSKEWAYLLNAVSTYFPYEGMTTRIVIRSTAWTSTSSNSIREQLYRDHLRPMPGTEDVIQLFLSLLEICVVPENSPNHRLVQAVECR